MSIAIVPWPNDPPSAPGLDPVDLLDRLAALGCYEIRITEHVDHGGALSAAWRRRCPECRYEMATRETEDERSVARQAVLALILQHEEEVDAEDAAEGRSCHGGEA